MTPEKDVKILELNDLQKVKNAPRSIKRGCVNLITTDLILLSLVTIGNNYLQHPDSINFEQLEEISGLQLENRSNNRGKVHFESERGRDRKFSEWADRSKSRRFYIIPRNASMTSIPSGHPDLPQHINYAFGNTQHFLARDTDKGSELYFVRETQALDEKLSGRKFVSSLRNLEFGGKILDWFVEVLMLSNAEFKNKLATMNLAEFLDAIQENKTSGKAWLVEACNLLLSGAEHRKDLFSADDYVKCQDLVRPALVPEYDISFIATVPHVDPSNDVGIARTNLKSCLTQVRDLARANELGNWVQVFDKCLSFLETAPSGEWFISLMRATGHSNAAMQLLSASIEADVFGGMGSWNDVVTSNMEEYQRLTGSLFQAVQQGFRTAINEGI